MGWKKSTLHPEIIAPTEKNAGKLIEGFLGIRPHDSGTARRLPRIWTLACSTRPKEAQVREGSNVECCYWCVHTKDWRRWKFDIWDETVS